MYPGSDRQRRSFGPLGLSWMIEEAPFILGGKSQGGNGRNGCVFRLSSPQLNFLKGLPSGWAQLQVAQVIF